MVAVAAAPDRGGACYPRFGRALHRRAAQTVEQRAAGSLHRQWLDRGACVERSRSGDRRCPERRFARGAVRRHRADSERQRPDQPPRCGKRTAPGRTTCAGELAAGSQTCRGIARAHAFRLGAGNPLAQRWARLWRCRRDGVRAVQARPVEDSRRCARSSAAGAEVRNEPHRRLRRHRDPRRNARRAPWHRVGAGIARRKSRQRTVHLRRWQGSGDGEHSSAAGSAQRNRAHRHRQ